MCLLHNKWQVWPFGCPDRTQLDSPGFLLDHRDRLEQLERQRERDRKLREQQKEQREFKERERRAEERRKERDSRRDGQWKRPFCVQADIDRRIISAANKLSSSKSNQVLTVTCCPQCRHTIGCCLMNMATSPNKAIAAGAPPTCQGIDPIMRHGKVQVRCCCCCFPSFFFFEFIQCGLSTMQQISFSSVVLSSSF